MGWANGFIGVGAGVVFAVLAKLTTIWLWDFLDEDGVWVGFMVWFTAGAVVGWWLSM